MKKHFSLLRIFGYGCCIAILCLLYGFFIEPKTLAVRHVTVISKNWQGPDLRIGLMADIHIGGWHVDARRAAKLASTMNDLSPDIVLLAGDYVDGHTPLEEHSKAFNSEIALGISNLAQIKAPLGVYAAIGNHDAWYSRERVPDRTHGLAALSSIPNICLLLIREIYPCPSRHNIAPSLTQMLMCCDDPLNPQGKNSRKGFVNKEELKHRY